MRAKCVEPALLVVLSGIVAALHIGKMPVAIPVLREALGITLVEAGFLLATVQFAGMSVGVLIGTATDGIGLRRSVIAGQLILAVAGLGSLWVEQSSTLLLFRALEGLGFLLVVLSAPGLIRQLIPPSRLPQYLGLWGAYMGTGASLALLCAPAIMALIGWRGLWVMLAALSTAMALWAAMAIPSDAQRRTTILNSPSRSQQSRWWQRLVLTLGSREPWRVAIAFALYSSQWLAVIGFLPSIAEQAGYSKQAAGVLTALACAANVSGSVAAGRLLHRGFSARHLLCIAYLSMILTTFLAFSSFTDDLPGLRYLVVVLFSAIGGLIPGTLFSVVVDVAPNEHTVSTTVGWMQQCSSMGQFFGPPAVAMLAASVGGWHMTWVATAICSLIGLILSVGLKFRRTSKPPSLMQASLQSLPSTAIKTSTSAP